MFDLLSETRFWFVVGPGAVLLFLFGVNEALNGRLKPLIGATLGLALVATAAVGFVVLGWGGCLAIVVLFLLSMVAVPIGFGIGGSLLRASRGG